MDLGHDANLSVALVTLTNPFLIFQLGLCMPPKWQLPCYIRMGPNILSRNQLEVEHVVMYNNAYDMWTILAKKVVFWQVKIPSTKGNIKSKRPHCNYLRFSSGLGSDTLCSGIWFHNLTLKGCKVSIHNHIHILYGPCQVKILYLLYLWIWDLFLALSYAKDKYSYLTLTTKIPLKYLHLKAPNLHI